MRVTTSLLCAAVGLVLQQATAFLPPASFPSSKPASATVLRMAAEAVEVPMDLIKKLRGMSGAPIMDCKKALAEEKLGRVGRMGGRAGERREGGRGRIDSIGSAEKGRNAVNKHGDKPVLVTTSS